MLGKFIAWLMGDTKKASSDLLLALAFGIMAIFHYWKYGTYWLFWFCVFACCCRLYLAHKKATRAAQSEPEG